jgi:hypothetical protein
VADRQRLQNPEGRSQRAGKLPQTKNAVLCGKVNLSEKKRLGFTYLRPIQVAYESPKFMLPIRLGMVNADGPQELFVYALSQKGASRRLIIAL